MSEKSVGDMTPEKKWRHYRDKTMPSDWHRKLTMQAIGDEMAAEIDRLRALISEEGFIRRVTWGPPLTTETDK